MKRRVLIILVSVVLVCGLLCAGGVALNTWLAYRTPSPDQRAQALAQQIADALGRTPADHIVDFRSCGMFTCGYNVYFTSAQEFAGMDARLHALSTLNLRVGLASPGGGSEPLLINMNDGLDRTPIRGRLTVTSTSVYREPGFSYWVLQNERGETVCTIWLYRTKDWGVTYLFDGKPLPNANIVRVYTEVSPRKE